MRWWPAALLVLAAAASCTEDVEIIEAQHRESRDSYLEAYQQSHSGNQPTNLPQKEESGFHVYGAPVPQYGPAKEEMPLYGPPAPQYGAPPLKQVKEPNMYYGIPHFHHHYTVSEPPPPAEIMEQSQGHGGFELSTVLKFLAKLFVLKLLVKKIYLIMTLLWLPKVKLLEWLVNKKKTKPASNKPDKPSKPPQSDEIDDIEDEDDDVMSFFSRSSRGLNDLEHRVSAAIHKQAQDSD